MTPEQETAERADRLFGFWKPFLERLRNEERFPVGIDDFLTLRELLEKLPPDFENDLLAEPKPDSRWRLLLRPLLTGSEQQQQRFDVIFDDFIGGLIPPVAKITPGISWWKRHGRLIISLLGIAGVLALLVSMTVCVFRNIPKGSPCAFGCTTPVASPTPVATSSSGAISQPTGTSTAVPAVSPFVSVSPSLPVSGSPFPIAPTSTQAPPTAGYIDQYLIPGLLTPWLLLPIMVGFGVLMLYRMINDYLTLQRITPPPQKKEQPPLDWLMTDFDAPPNPYLLPGRRAPLLRAAKALAIGETIADMRRLDVVRTVNQFVTRGGWLDHFHFLPTTANPGYLLLIERRHFCDQQAALFESLAAALKSQGVELTVFTFREDCEHVYPKGLETPIPLADLQNGLSDCRVLIFASEQVLQGRFKDTADAIPSDLSLSPGIRIALQWKRGAFFSPTISDFTSVGWASDQLEKQSEGRFVALPATVQGVLAAARLFLKPPVRLGHDEQLNQQLRLLRSPDSRGAISPEDASSILLPLPPNEVGIASHCAQLERHPIFLWVAAMALYRQIAWELLIRIGEQIERKTGTQLITEQNLLALVSLPYIRDGEMPASLRSELFRLLKHHAPELVMEISGMLGVLLRREDNIPPKWAYAFQRHQLEQYIQERIAEDTVLDPDTLDSSPSGLVMIHPLIQALVRLASSEAGNTASSSSTQDKSSSASREAVERDQLIIFLEGLTDADLSRVISRVEGFHDLSPSTAPEYSPTQSTSTSSDNFQDAPFRSTLYRVAALVQFAESAIGPGLFHIATIVKELFGSHALLDNTQSKSEVRNNDQSRLASWWKEKTHVSPLPSPALPPLGGIVASVIAFTGMLFALLALGIYPTMSVFSPRLFGLERANVTASGAILRVRVHNWLPTALTLEYKLQTLKFAKTIGAADLMVAEKKCSVVAGGVAEASLLIPQSSFLSAHDPALTPSPSASVMSPSPGARAGDSEALLDYTVYAKQHTIEKGKYNLRGLSLTALVPSPSPTLSPTSPSPFPSLLPSVLPTALISPVPTVSSSPSSIEGLPSPVSSSTPRPSPLPTITPLPTPMPSVSPVAPDLTGLSLGAAAAAIAGAEADAGVQEIPRNSNKGPRVEEYQSAVGLKTAHWCVAFVYWCVDQAAQRTGKPNPLAELRPTTVVQMFKWGDHQGLLLPEGTPAIPGDIFLVLPATSSSNGQAGFVVSAGGDQKNLSVVEGNIKGTGKNAGVDGVYRLNRKFSRGYRLLRLDKTQLPLSIASPTPDPTPTPYRGVPAA